MKKENTKFVPYELRLIDSARFMRISLSNLFDRLAEGIQNIKYKYMHKNKIAKYMQLNKKGLEYANVKII